MVNVLKAGLYTTIQDGGRLGYLNRGVPVAGFMDTITAHKVNLMLENEAEAAVMEITMTGPTLEFEEPTYICFGGAEIPVTCNNESMAAYKVHAIKAGDILSFGKLENGFRSYLAIKGGFQNKEVLGSRSLYAPITPKNHLENRDKVPYPKMETFQPKLEAIKVDSFLDETVLGVSEGPEYEVLNDKQLEALFSKGFSVSNENDRMAYQLEETIPGHELSILTSATLPGTVQLTPSGKIIILMKDGQTTGGYPRILQLTDKAISVLAQKKFGDTVTFKHQ